MDDRTNLLLQSVAYLMAAGVLLSGLTAVATRLLA